MMAFGLWYHKFPHNDIEISIKFLTMPMAIAIWIMNSEIIRQRNIDPQLFYLAYVFYHFLSQFHAHKILE